jgi:hypothetical protein
VTERPGAATTIAALIAAMTIGAAHTTKRCGAI